MVKESSKVCHISAKARKKLIVGGKIKKILKLDNKKNIRINIVECNKTLYLNTERILSE